MTSCHTRFDVHSAAFRLIEAEAIAELNKRHEMLPQAPESADDITLGKVQIATLAWELEVAVTRQELAQSRFDELTKLTTIATVRLFHSCSYVQHVSGSGVNIANIILWALGRVCGLGSWFA